MKQLNPIKLQDASQEIQFAHTKYSITSKGGLAICMQMLRVSDALARVHCPRRTFLISRSESALENE